MNRSLKIGALLLCTIATAVRADETREMDAQHTSAPVEDTPIASHSVDTQAVFSHMAHDLDVAFDEATKQGDVLLRVAHGLGVLQTVSAATDIDEPLRLQLLEHVQGRVLHLVQEEFSAAVEIMQGCVAGTHKGLTPEQVGDLQQRITALLMTWQVLNGTPLEALPTRGLDDQGVMDVSLEMLSRSKEGREEIANHVSGMPGSLDEPLPTPVVTQQTSGSRPSSTDIAKLQAALVSMSNDSKRKDSKIDELKGQVTGLAVMTAVFGVTAIVLSVYTLWNYLKGKNEVADGVPRISDVQNDEALKAQVRAVIQTHTQLPERKQMTPVIIQEGVDAMFELAARKTTAAGEKARVRWRKVASVLVAPGEADEVAQASELAEKVKSVRTQKAQVRHEAVLAARERQEVSGEEGLLTEMLTTADKTGKRKKDGDKVGAEVADAYFAQTEADDFLTATVCAEVFHIVSNYQPKAHGVADADLTDEQRRVMDQYGFAYCTDTLWRKKELITAKSGYVEATRVAPKSAQQRAAEVARVFTTSARSVAGKAVAGAKRKVDGLKGKLLRSASAPVEGGNEFASQDAASTDGEQVDGLHRSASSPTLEAPDRGGESEEAASEQEADGKDGVPLLSTVTNQDGSELLVLGSLDEADDDQHDVTPAAPRLPVLGRSASQRPPGKRGRSRHRNFKRTQSGDLSSAVGQDAQE